MNGDDYTRKGAADMRDELAKAEAESGCAPTTCSAIRRFDVCNQTWLVPDDLVSDEFDLAVRKLKSAKCGDVVHWTDQERSEFLRILTHPKVWRPF